MTQEQFLKNLSVPAGDIDCVLDTDTYNEIDDQFALSLMVKSPKLHIRALLAAPFFNSNSTSPEDGMERSYDEILNLLELMGRKDLKQIVFKGSRTYLPDENTPVDSPAADMLVELALTYTPEKPLYVVAIGAITNVASALLKKPEIKENIVVVWLGGHSEQWFDTNEFNMMQDVAAARVVMGCGCPVVQLPCMGVASTFYVSGPELEYWLKGQNPLCDYLVRHTVEAANAYANGRVWSRVIWDVTAVAWLLNDGDRFMFSEVIPALIPQYDHHYSHDVRRHPMRRVTFINRDALMQELVEALRRNG
ncbi:MAG: nucleoside hydrolase [Clostridia bacterium]|nr:nucleoside hydrolase [Clostridia bacterium]